jgi:hypothetical protein
MTESFTYPLFRSSNPPNLIEPSISGSKLLLVVGVLTPKKRTKVHTTNPNLDLLILLFHTMSNRILRCYPLSLRVNRNWQ